MKKLILVVLLIQSANFWAQTDYSSNWEDYYSYSHVVDFVKNQNKLYAVAETALFTFDESNNQLTKISSVNGLSGDDTSVVHFSAANDLTVIGYENGLMEIIDQNGKIIKIVDIFLTDISPNKQINSIFEHNNKVYLSMPFGVVVYDLLRLEFADTYFIGPNSSSIQVNDVAIHNNFIYAATTNGIYIANYSSNLTDSDNWNQNFSGTYSQLGIFNNEVIAVKDKTLSTVVNQNSLVSKITLSLDIVDFSVDGTNIIIGTNTQGHLYNSSYALQVSTNASSHTLTSVGYQNGSIYLGTNEKGILKSSTANPNSFQEIHPEGPKSNSVFAFGVKDQHIWCVYDGYDVSYFPSSKRNGYSHFNGTNWFNVASLATGLSAVTVDPNNPNKAYLSAWAQTGSSNPKYSGGVLIVENDQEVDFWSYHNSGLDEVFPDASGYYSVRIGGVTFDDSGNLWASNALVTNGLLKKYSSEGVWSDHSLSISGLSANLNEVVVDKNNQIWIGSLSTGLLGYKEDGDKKVRLTFGSGSGNLPHNNVRSIAVDNNNRIWVGTFGGLVVFDDSDNAFSGSYRDADIVRIVDEGIVKPLLGTSVVNDIYVDGVNNKWFATASGGALQTNSTGLKTLNNFNKDNSPLPSNEVLAIQMDDATGKVYFATPKGIVAFNSGVAGYGEELTEVYGYPNPALKQHETISIVGKDGMNLPQGTNVKILDVAGNLVFESNTIEGQSNFGGKIVWDKKNLEGKKVASGVYVVLLFNTSGSQTSSTKIAVIN